MQVQMVGRKRGRGNREPNGRLQREEKPVDTRLLAAVMPHRRDLPERAQDSPLAESNFGRLLLNGKITGRQYAAGIRYRDIVLRYRAVMSIPSHSPPSMSGIIVGAWRGGRGLSEDDIADRRDAYNAAFEALESGAGNRGARAVAHVCIFEREHYDLKVLQCGLNVLMRHFELVGRGRIQ